MKGECIGDALAFGSAKADFSWSGVAIEDLLDGLGMELSRIRDQLSPKYLFQSDMALPAEKRDVIRNFIKADGTPTFHAYKADPKGVVKLAERIFSAYGEPKNVVVIGNGGSISSLDAIYSATLKMSPSEKRLFIVDSMEPDYIAAVKRECGIKDTIVVPVSRSGKTQGVLDAFDQFAGYKVVAITSLKPDNPLLSKVAKALKKTGVRGRTSDLVVSHPLIGGRYTGRTEVATLPMALLGMTQRELRAFDDGAREAYKRVGHKAPLKRNPALRLASSLMHLERRDGRDIIFSPMYSHRLDGFGHLITQLLHESSGKMGGGQTILSACAPECQHHTNQRLFGGKRNMAAVFFKVEKPMTSGLKAQDGLPLQKALHLEYEGTREDATFAGIPSFTVSLSDASPHAIGSLLAFCQYAFGVYPALLRDVNPFDQPQVENSKNISKRLRREWLGK